MQRDERLQEQITVRNTEKHLSLQTQLEGTGKSSAVVSDIKNSSQDDFLALTPIILNMRSDAIYSRNLSKYTTTGKITKVAGNDCIEFMNGAKTDGTLEILHPDRNCDWVVRRIESYSGPILSIRFDIDYLQDSSIGWMPTTWTYATRLSEKIPLVSGSLKIKEYRVNPQISRSIFYPNINKPSTFVFTNSMDGGPSSGSVVQDDGSLGVVMPSNQIKSYEQLVQANKAAKRQRIWLIAIGSAALLILGTILVRWQRRKRNRMSDTPPPATA